MTPLSKISEISYFRPIRPIQAVGMKYNAFLMQNGKFTCRRLFCEILVVLWCLDSEILGGGVESTPPMSYVEFERPCRLGLTWQVSRFYIPAPHIKLLYCLKVQIFLPGNLYFKNIKSSIFKTQPQPKCYSLNQLFLENSMRK